MNISGVLNALRFYILCNGYSLLIDNVFKGLITIIVIRLLFKVILLFIEENKD